MATYPYAVTNSYGGPTAVQDPNKKKLLPTWDNQVQAVPLVQQPTQPAQPQQQAQPQPNALQQGSAQVMQTAQQKSMQGYQSPIMDQVAASTQKLLKDPNAGRNFEQEKQLGLEQQNRNLNQQMETLRQQTAPTAYTGQNLRDLTNVALQAVQQRADTGRQYDIERAKAERENMLSALAQGQNVAQQQRTAFDQDLQNLLNTRAAYEGEAGRTQQTQLLDKAYSQDIQKMAIANGYDLTKLDKQYGQQMATMIAQNNWQGVQNELDRQAAIAQQTGNIQAQKDLAILQSNLDIDKLTSQQNWQGAQAELDRALEMAKQTNDITAQQALLEKQNEFDLKKLNITQDWQSAQNKITQNLQLAMQANDINATAANIEKQIALDRWKQENGQQFTAEQNAINNALQVSLKTMDIQSATNLMELKNKLDTGMLVKEQDFTAIQNDLNRQLETATVERNIAAQYELTQLKGQIDAAAQEAQNKYQTAERIATQAFASSERISTQDYQTATQYLTQQHDLAMQENDIRSQQNIADQRNKLDLLMQTNEMNAQEKMMYLGAQLEEAKATNDVERQKSILDFTHTQEMQKIYQAQGFEAAQAYNNQQFQLAMQNNDFVQAQVLQRNQLEFQAKEAIADRALEQARIKLTERGIDMQQIELRYNMINQEIDAGRAAPDAAINYLNTELQGTGIKLTAVDAQKAAQEAMDAEYNSQVYQFAKTHPAYVDQTTGTLTADGQKAFLDFFNKSVYGETTMKDLISGIADASELQGGANADSPNAATYQTLLNDPQIAWTPAVSTDNRGTWSPDVRTINNAPAKGKYFTYDGKLYMSTSDVTEESAGQNYQYFTALDVNSGQTITVRANDAGNWVKGFPVGSTTTTTTNTAIAAQPSTATSKTSAPVLSMAG